MDALPPGLLDGIGIGGILIVLFWLLVTGRIATRNTVDDVRHDRDEWRTEARIKDQEIAEKNRQLDHLAEVGRTVDAVLRALKSGPPAPPTGPTGGA